VLGEPLLIWSDAPAWLTIGLGICALVNFLLFGCAYIFFMVKDPDALRSESYSLQKLALQKGLFGDSIQGLSTVDAPPSHVMVVTGTAPQEQQEP
jgi:hypothetical protein